MLGNSQFGIISLNSINKSDPRSLLYHHDKRAKGEDLSADQRLRFHQGQSGPVMEILKEWLQKQFDQWKVEPNSSMGKAITYMLKHWELLTLFLRVPGAPLDNNLCEQVLKRAILHRKNSLFFKTEHDTYIGDLFMSLIHTCSLNRVSPFHYLTNLQKNASELVKNLKLGFPGIISRQQQIQPNPTGTDRTPQLPPAPVGQFPVSILQNLPEKTQISYGGISWRDLRKSAFALPEMDLHFFIS